VKLDGSTSMRGRVCAVLIVMIGACGGRGNGTPSAPSGSGGAGSPGADRTLPLQDTPPGLELRVSPGKQGPPAFDRTKLAPARPLRDADVAAVLQRM